ncbi:MAG: epoxyqueuosine reductase QueH [Deltaproteobacteria bacterium]
MKVLLHICCGPCAVYPATSLRDQGHAVAGFFYNPNIQPYEEYGRRYEAVVAAAERLSLDVIYHRYDDQDFLRCVRALQRDRQHEACWRIRLEETARVARARGFEGFTTTLLSSPYQDIGAIGRIGGEIGASTGLTFLAQNFRQGFAEGHRLSREWKLYHQNYCGCAASEQESAAARAKKSAVP